MGFSPPPRLALWLPALLLAGCGEANETPDKVIAKAKAEDRAVSCRLEDAPAFADTCSLEWRGTNADGAWIVVLRHKDGGFRRLILSPDGTLGQADGAQTLLLEKDAGKSLYVSLGSDHYRLRLDQLDAVQ